MTTTNDRFAHNLQRARHKFGISQEELAFRAALHPKTISKFERGGCGPRAEVVVKLATVLGIKPEALLEGISWEEEARRFRCEPPG
jgi:transcriptional regulator with XRE-family HTH domain